MMAEVFVVTIGEYDNNHVVGVYSTKCAADEIAVYCGGEVNSFELDRSYAEYKEGFKPWHVCVLKSGEITYTQEKPECLNQAGGGGTFREWKWVGRDISGWDVWVMAKDEREAIELAREMVPF